MPLQVLTSYTWPTVPFSLAIAKEGLDALVGRLGLPLQTWDEDGLGPVRGIGIRLSGGRVVLVQEHLHLVQQKGPFAGPEILVDAAEVASLGVERVLREVLSELGISTDALLWRQPESAATSATQMAESYRRWKAKQGGGPKE